MCHICNQKKSNTEPQALKILKLAPPMTNWEVPKNVYRISVELDVNWEELGNYAESLYACQQVQVVQTFSGSALFSATNISIAIMSLRTWAYSTSDYASILLCAHIQLQVLSGSVHTSNSYYPAAATCPSSYLYTVIKGVVKAGNIR